MLLTNEEKHWELLLKSFSLDYLLKDPKFNTKDSRELNKKQLKPILQEKFITLSYEEVREKLISTGIVFTKIVKTEDTIKDPQTNLNNMFMDIKGELIEDLQVVSPPLNIENSPRINATKAPKLGEHNVEILKELGYTDKEIKGMQNNKVIL